MTISPAPAISLIMIDGHALIYRAYHAYPGLTTREGVLVNAVYGFARILLTALRDFEPTHALVAFDHPQPTFRHQEYQDYKAHRAEMPDDLKPQVELIKHVVTALNIPQFEVPGFEADDIVGTLSAQAENTTEVEKTVIITGDKDLLQLVSDRTHVFLPKRGKFGQDIEYTPSLVMEKQGYMPSQVTDIKALMGDSSDNIPGVPGIGAKTAIKLIAQFGSLQALYQAVDADKGQDTEQLEQSRQPKLTGVSASVVEKLTTHKEQAFLSQQLATIDRRVPIELDLDACQIQRYDKEAAISLFEEFDFKSLVPLLPDDSFETGVQAALF